MLLILHFALSFCILIFELYICTILSSTIGLYGGEVGKSRGEFDIIIFMFSKYGILIFSKNPDRLMKFYRDVLKLELESELKLPNDYGYMFIVNKEFKIWIGKHDKVQSRNPDPFRHIFNLYVKSVSEWYEKIKNEKQVKIVCKPEETPFSTPKDRWYVSTFLDPEGNCFQFMGRK